MKKGLVILAAAVMLTVSAGNALAHFGMIIPSDDIVEKGEPRQLSLDLMFIHPFEGHYMEMAKPARFGVLAHGEKKDLSDTLTPKKVNGFTTWQASYSITRPGDYVFYDEPEPYWESAEDCFIVHYTKVVVGTFGLEDGWDKEVGLKTEIVPLTRPYGLWSGNVFQGVVKVDGKPVPHADVEVEYYNKGGKIKPPADPYITQVVKADQNGVFTYAMPREGWWGFAALSTDDRKLVHEGKEYPVEIGAVIWVRTRDMK